MARNSAIKHKHYALDEAKIKRAQKLLGTKTETETIERAIEEVISEREDDAARGRPPNASSGVVR
ncbi:MAG: hypothetical protein DMG13_27890 [Acidobacteria bacterium]|nr:MAG: hypothetical protein DMG13_27890 [Acidobacteriota bacterium]